MEIVSTDLLLHGCVCQAGYMDTDDEKVHCVLVTG